MDIMNNNEIILESSISIQKISSLLNDTKASSGRTIEQSIERANKAYKENFIKVRNKVLGKVSWGLRPYVLYRVNKHFEHIL